MSTLMTAVLLFQSSAVERAQDGLTVGSTIFMLVAMLSVTALAAWCFKRVLTTKDHFDPDGTGPASPPVKGEVEKT